MPKPTRAEIANALKAACTPLAALLSDLNELKTLHIKATALQDSIIADPDLADAVDLDALDHSLDALSSQIDKLDAIVAELRGGSKPEASSRVA